MSSKCAQCGKTVYFNEKQSYDGKDFHGLCMQQFKKAQKPGLVGYYPGDGDRVTGQLNTGGGSAPAAAPAPAAGGAKFCASCGTARGAGNFCANCGAKF